MKNILKKVSLILVLAVAVLVTSSIYTIEPAEAYYGDWKSQTTACKIRVSVWEYVSDANGTSGTLISTTGVQDGTFRKCVDGSGWCFWGSSCVANG